MKDCLHIFLFLMFASASVQARTDDFPQNSVYVKSSPNGLIYAKAIPAAPFGSKGITKIYAVREGEDQLIESYNWYAEQIDLNITSQGITVVRFGSWRRDRKSEELAIGFYLSGKTVREYTGGEIHDITRRAGFHGLLRFPQVSSLQGGWLVRNGYAFSVSSNGYIIRFNTVRGTVIRTEKLAE